MDNLKRAKVHRLPTDKATEGNAYIFKSGFHLAYLNYWEKHKEIDNHPQHLYFTPSDEEIKRNPSINEIKEGDWVLWFWDGGQIGVTAPQQYLGGEQVLNSGHRKIIVSTDPKLNSNQIEPYDTSKPYGIEFPQPSQDFIKAYCEQGGIDEVDVEHEIHWKKRDGISIKEWNKAVDEARHTHSPNKYLDISHFEPKLNPDNTIATHRIVEKMYSLEEICKASMYFAYTSYPWTETEIEAWVKAVDFDEMD